jgi:8-amino-3,8-dideoxy-alpha-D-manno-octulosonate transaminase
MPGWELIGMEERRAVMDVFELAPQGHLFTNKAKVREFEQAVAAHLGMEEAVSVSSGSAALKVGLTALGVRRGDEVITQAHTFVATVEAIVECGATPIIADIDDTLNMDPLDLRKKITDKTKVILPVHMLGVAARMSEIMAIAQYYRLFVLEDTAQAFSGTWRGRTLGTLGDVGCFSFSYSKLLTTGEGGMVVARDPAVLHRARAYADHGHDSNPAAPSRGQDTHTRPGFNFRLGAFQAAVGLAQLRKVEASLKVHRAHKAALKAALRQALPSLRFRTVPDESGDLGDAVVFFLETEPQAQQVARRLFEQDHIALKNLPDALNWHYAGEWGHLLGQQANTLTISGDLLRRSVALQVSARWTEPDILRLAQTVAAAVKEVT